MRTRTDHTSLATQDDSVSLAVKSTAISHRHYCYIHTLGSCLSDHAQVYLPKFTAEISRLSTAVTHRPHYCHSIHTLGSCPSDHAQVYLPKFLAGISRLSTAFTHRLVYPSSPEAVSLQRLHTDNFCYVHIFSICL